jgi:hypothetical protein
MPASRASGRTKGPLDLSSGLTGDNRLTLPRGFAAWHVFAVLAASDKAAA